MLQKFYPEQTAKSAYHIDYEKLYLKGFRGLLFDIDNTLVKHGEDATKDAIALFEQLKKLGFQICLISNNKMERVERFNNKVQVNYIYDAHKPSKKNYLKAMEIMGTDLTNTMFIGDQLFTDVFGASRIGMHNYLVEPVDKQEEIQIVLKRYLEKIVLFFYRRRLKKQNR